MTPGVSDRISLGLSYYAGESSQLSRNRSETLVIVVRLVFPEETLKTFETQRKTKVPRANPGAARCPGRARRGIIPGCPTPGGQRSPASKQASKQPGNQARRQAGKQASKHASQRAGGRAGKPAGKLVGELAGRQAGRQAGRDMRGRDGSGQGGTGRDGTGWDGTGRDRTSKDSVDMSTALPK